MPSKNTAGAETSDSNTGIESLGELLNASEPVEPDAGESNGDASGSEEAPPSKFNDLAGRLGMDLDALYKLEISQAEDGSPVTIEALKDHYAKQGDLSLREIEFEERRTQQESSLLQAQEELRELMASLPERAIQPEVLQKIRDKAAATRALENQRTLEVISEWNDEAVRAKDIQGMVEHLQQYGYPVNHLEHVSDHRQMRYIRDNWQREQRIRTALAKVRAGKPNPTTAQKPADKAPQKTPVTGVKKTGNHANKLEALFAQLK